MSKPTSESVIRGLLIEIVEEVAPIDAKVLVNTLCARLMLPQETFRKRGPVTTQLWALLYEGVLTCQESGFVTLGYAYHNNHGGLRSLSIEIED